MSKKKADKSSAKKSARKDGVVSDTGGTPVPMIAKGALETLMKQVMIFTNRVSTSSGDLGDLIRTYAEKKSLHKGAFSDIKKLYRMGKKDPGKLWLHLAHFDDMREKLKLDDLAEQQGQLVEPGTEEDEETDTETPIKTDDQVRQVAESAGAKLN